MECVKFFKVNELPSVLKPDAFYYVEDGDKAQAYITDNYAQVKQVGNSEFINAIINSRIVQEAGDDENLIISQAAITDLFLQKSKLLSETGLSTTNTMTQRAISEAIAEAAGGMPETDGLATLTSTNNKIEKPNVVSDLSLEIGDVIQLQYDGYDKLHTVESIINNNEIIVNYEHCGSRGNGSLKLADETATVTIKRIAKWYNAPIGLGQAWVDVRSVRNAGVEYTPPYQRSIQVMLSGNVAYGGNGDMRYYVNNIQGSSNETGSVNSRAFVNAFFTCNINESYKAAPSAIVIAFAERR